MRRSVILGLYFILANLKVLAQPELQPHAIADAYNTGNLRFWKYIPETPENSEIPLVIAFHGCTQSAKELSKLAGFIKMADQYKFALLFPEQKPSNNPSLCFNWFNSRDVLPGNGELESVKRAMKLMILNHPIDSSRVFTYGLSAGAMMSIAMLVNYPTEIKAGASLAGAPFDSNRDLLSGLDQMIKPHSKPNELLAKSILDIHSGSTVYLPQISIFHGLADQIVDPENSLLLCKQWLYAQGIKEDIEFANEHSVKNTRLIEQVFMRDSLEKMVILRRFEGLGHALPLEIGPEDHQGGSVGRYGKDIGFFSTWFILQDWGIIERKD